MCAFLRWLGKDIAEIMFSKFISYKARLNKYGAREARDKKYGAKLSKYGAEIISTGPDLKVRGQR
jgi:hypothetical protein